MNSHTNTPSDMTTYLETGRRILERMSASPCEFIELAFAAEKYALETTGADRAELRSAVQTIDASDTWTAEQRAAFAAYVSYLKERMD